MTYSRDCGNDARCATTDTPAENGQCTYFNPYTQQFTHWQDWDAAYSTLGACAAIEVTKVDDTHGRIHYRTSTATFTTQAPGAYTSTIGCAWKDQDGNVVKDCSKALVLCTAYICVWDFHTAYPEPKPQSYYELDFCARNTIYQNGFVFRRTSEQCVHIGPT
ncbi:MAG TPA: hypothetical protein VGR28_01685 [Candidatus Thermoplasmatota archaeon]|jgi:hypothetical protein|nr:hypothetical protein [Candidatus Thermoplasmatota archaeon]